MSGIAEYRQVIADAADREHDLALVEREAQPLAQMVQQFAEFSRCVDVFIVAVKAATEALGDANCALGRAFEAYPNGNDVGEKQVLQGGEAGFDSRHISSEERNEVWEAIAERVAAHRLSGEAK